MCECCSAHAEAQVTLNVEGMSCGHCSAAVTKALQAVAGVKGVDVDLAGKKVTITYLPDQSGVKEFKEAIVNAGYEVLA